MQYVALLRGIMPTNPNMKGEKLKKVLEDLGFKNVHPVIASGNLVFESGISEPEKIEKKIEKGSTPDFMREIEKKYGKGLTTRTWTTIQRILKKMGEVE